MRMLEAKLDVPQVVDLSAVKGKLKIPIRAEIANTCEDDVVLHIGSAEDKFCWSLLDEAHHQVARMPPAKKARKVRGVEPFVSATVAGGLSVHSTEELVLDPSVLEDGRTYIVEAVFWGQMASASFVAIRPELALLSLVPAKKAAVRKKAKKKVVRKKPAKRKVAKKAVKKAVKKKAKRKASSTSRAK